MLTKLAQTAYIQPTTPQLISVWDSAFYASRAFVTYAVENDMSQKDVFKVAISQLPFQKLVLGELEAFREEGWGAIPGFEGSFSKEDESAISAFCHDKVPSHVSLMTRVEATNGRPKAIKIFHQRAKSSYRVLLSLKDMIDIIAKEELQHADSTVEIVNDIFEEYLVRPRKEAEARVIFRNILSNSFKYGSERVRVWMEGGVLCFQDDGIGMSPDFAKKLGNGERLRGESFATVPGEGIGWFTIGKIASGNNWNWQIETAKDKGTTVTLSMGADILFGIKERLEEYRRAKRNNGRLVSADQIVDQVDRFFQNAKPFDGYNKLRDNVLDISNSPIYNGIVIAKNLMESFIEILNSR